MKKTILSLLLVITIVASAFASEEIIDKNVINAFNKEFSAAQNVKWTAEKNYYKATFTYYDKTILAIYDKKAYLLGVVRNLLVTDLPYYLQKELKEYYSDYWVIDLFELSNEKGTSYHATLKNSSEKVVVSSSEHNSWEVTNYSKTN